MNLEVMKKGLTTFIGRKGLIIQKYSPEILMVVGVVGTVASTVMACKATLKVDVILDEAKETIDKINDVKETTTEEVYSVKDHKKDLVITYVQTGVKLGKLYGPSLLVGAASIGCLLGAHGILKKRNIALIAAYKTVSQSFADYRSRVVEEFGEEKDRHLKNNIKKTVVKTTDENGKKIKTEIEEPQRKGYVSEYARFFDDGCKGWDKNPEYNLTFLVCQQNYANDLLQARGHVFLNEIYDLLGIPHTKAGAIVGWINNSSGDSYVDFGIFEKDSMKCRDFVNGYERTILLDFNVDGIIYDLL